MAPITTVVGLFSVFEGIYRQIKITLTHLGKDHLVVMGAGEDAMTFMKNLSGDDEKIKVICLLDEKDKVDEARLEGLNILLVRLDYSNPEAKTNSLILKDNKIGDMGIVVCFEEEPMAYGKLASLYQRFGQDPPKLRVYIQSQNYRFKEIVEFKMDELINFDIHYFNTNSLLINKVLYYSDFKAKDPEILKASWEKLDPGSYRDLAKATGAYHICIIGFSPIGEEFLSQATNLWTLNPIEKMRVSIIDKKAGDKFESYSAYRKNIDRVMDIKTLDMDPASRQVLEEIKDLQDEPFSAVLFTDEDFNANVLNLDRIIDSIDQSPIALYSPDQASAKALVESFKMRHDNISIFGDKSKVLTKSIILDESLLDKAKAFNAFYNDYAGQMMGWGTSDQSIEDQWLPLSNIKKESNEFQVRHQETKKLLMEKISQIKKPDQGPDQLVKKWEESIQGKTVAEQVDLVEADPCLNFMTALEHKRWSNFYYMRDFSFHEEKNEMKKRHDCLIDDWDEFLASIQRDKAIYDTMSTLILYK